MTIRTRSFLVALMLLITISATDLLAQRRTTRRLRWRRNCCRTVAPASQTRSRTDTWKSLFDGRSLAQWKSTNFGGEGKIEVVDGTIQMDFGYSLTGITYQGQVPKSNYEIRLEAMKVDGIDFFCGLTFPVAESHCSLIVGGWAGGIVGLSSIDGQDASENETTKYMTFAKKKWFKIRVRVTDDNISAWIDDKNVVDQQITNRKLGTRPEVDLSKPLGICAWETKAALRNIQIRKLKPGP